MTHLPLLSLAYLPPVSWFALLEHTETAVLEVHENYQKGSLRNRCHIAGPNGVQRLSIPLVKGKHQQMPIREARIAYDEPWQRLHWRSIRAAYGNAPFFEHYADTLALFFEKNYPFLFDFNLELLYWLMAKIKGRGELIHSQGFAPKDGRELLHDYRDAIGPEPDDWPDWFFPARYPQVFMEKTGFLPNLSALDLLFCTGNQAKEILEKSMTFNDLNDIQ